MTLIHYALVYISLILLFLILCDRGVPVWSALLLVTAILWIIIFTHVLITVST